MNLLPTITSPAPEVLLKDPDLPAWMRRAFRGTDWGALLTLVFSILIGWSFVVQPDSTGGNVWERSIFRTADTAEALVEGRLYPRWSPHIMGGIGAPFAHFLPPLPAYLPAVIDALFVDDSVLAVRLAALTAFVLGSTAVYAFSARRLGGSAALIASLLYMFSPTVGIIVPHLQGDLTHVFAHGLLPIFLWSFDGSLMLGRRLDLTALILSGSGLILTDPLWYALGILLIFPLMLPAASSYNRVTLRTTLLAVLAGGGLSAFYWLPALVERDLAVWLAPLPSAHPPITLGGLLSAFPLLDRRSMQPAYPHALGLSIMMFLILSLPLLLRRNAHLIQQVYGLIGIIGALILLFLIPEQTQLLGGVVLCLSIASSSAIRWRERLPARVQHLLMPFFIGALLISAATVWLTPRADAALTDFSPASQIAFEQSGFGFALLPDDQPVPTAQGMSTFMLTGSTAAENNPFEIITPGADAQIGTIAAEGHRYQFQVQTAQETEIRLQIAWFPGWQVTNSTITVSIAPGADGMIVVWIGAHQSGEFTIEFGATPARTFSWLATGLSAAAALLIVAFRPLVRQEHDELALFPLIPNKDAHLITAVAFVFTAAIGLFALPDAPYALGAAPGSGMSGSFPLRARTDVGLEALGYHIARADYQPGEKFTYTIYWRTLRFLDRVYTVQPLLLSRATGSPIVVGVRHHPGGYPTNRWVTNRYITDVETLTLPDSLAPGEYDLAVEVSACAPRDPCTVMDRLTFFSADGGLYGAILRLPVIVTVSG